MSDESDFITETEKGNYEAESDGDGILLPPISTEQTKQKVESGFPTQYTSYNGGYLPSSITVPFLKADCYDITPTRAGVVAVPAIKPSGLLLELPEMLSDTVIKVVENFWNSEKDYKEGNEFVVGGAAYKLGIMLFGPPGSGKSSVIKIVSKKIIERNGVVFHASHPGALMSFLNDFSRIEPNRKCVVILEDIDSLIYRYGDAEYLELLDSAKSIDNVLFIATTNYPDKLDPRIYNRPGRFSHVIKIGLPTAVTREAYLKAILKNYQDVEVIVKNTEGFTIDHLTCLINARYREKKDLVTEIERLRTLFKVPKSDESKGIGFNK